jgi:protein-tyrosine phosphatase
MVTRSRQVPLSRQANFRDLGGYRATDGRTVKWGLVFRSGELSQLDDDDIATLDGLGIKTVVDLRSKEEIAARGESRLPSGAFLRAMPIASSDMFAKIIPMMLAGNFSQVPTDLLDRVNRMLAADFAAEFAELLRMLADPTRRPLVFHCTQGKDRTGFGAAVVLSALGVPWDTVVEDYLLSNHYRKAENEKLLGMLRGFAADAESEEIAFERVQGLLYVKDTSLQAARDEIVDRHGSFEGYITEALGFSRESLWRLRDDLLE